MVHFIWRVMTERPFSLPVTKNGIHVGHVRMCATPYPISWIIMSPPDRVGTTVKDFSMKLGTLVNHDETMCHAQEP